MNPLFSRSRLIVIGFRRWKAYSLFPILSALFREVVYVPTVRAAERKGLCRQDFVAVWGDGRRVAGLKECVERHGATLLHIEDGFIRSVGLGSDLIAPISLVLDEAGIYFNPLHPSGLERLLNTHLFSSEELLRARRICDFIVANRLTKYNIDTLTLPVWLPDAAGRKIILVPGQVEDDASIRLGCTTVNTNLLLLQAARKACPDDFIVYKPHPDVLAKNRQGALAAAHVYADRVETESSIISLLEICSEVHTMTSLAGFDALLHGRRVVVYGRPFYAGWGLTEDLGQPFAAGRRLRMLTLEELAAATLLLYPIYFDWQRHRVTDCETALQQILQQRNALHGSGGIVRLKQGFIRRQMRKVVVLAYAFGSKWYK